MSTKPAEQWPEIELTVKLRDVQRGDIIQGLEQGDSVEVTSAENLDQFVDVLRPLRKNPGQAEVVGDHIVCGSCLAVDSIYELDQAVRFNYLSSVENGTITWSARDADFEHEAYKCDACDAELELDTDLDQDWI